MTDPTTPEEAGPTREPILFFDGMCGFCDASVHFVLDHEEDASLRFAPLQSELAKDLLPTLGVDPANLDTVVLVEDGSAFVRSEAAFRVARRLAFPWCLGGLLLVVPPRIRDLVYDFVARNRYRWFGRLEACRRPEPSWAGRFLATALLFLASAGAAPALEPEEARHLLFRTGFGGTPVELSALLPLSRADAVAKVLSTARAQASVPPPAWLADPFPDRKELKAFAMESEANKEAVQQEKRRRELELKAWWFQEMIETESPLTERMTLFWHNHFTSSFDKVGWPRFMAQQNSLLRQHALGDFGSLLRAIVRDPAMLVYLDGQQNEKGQPNENFARELLELFTLGEGHYTETDIKEAARAFTGLKVDRPNHTWKLARRKHDDGTKTFLGATGRFGPDDIVEVLLARPRTGEYLAGKLWREMISTPIPPEERTRLGALFRSSGNRIDALLRGILDSPAFWRPEERGTLIKSPVLLLVGVLRLLPLPFDDTRLVAQASRRLGQDLLAPPNVKGWPGGERWITSATLVARQQILQKAFSGVAEGGAPPPYPALDDPSLVRLLLATDPVDRLPRKTPRWDLVRRLVLDPAFQVH